MQSCIDRAYMNFANMETMQLTNIYDSLEIG